MLQKICLGFFKGLRTLAWPWQIWVALLVLLNGLVPLYFWDRIEAKAVLGAILAGAVIQGGIFAVRGFVRLLGAGHLVVWTPLLIWLFLRLETIGTTSLFGRWIVALLVIDGISWMIDLVDVGRYLAGDRTPSITLEDI